MVDGIGTATTRAVAFWFDTDSDAYPWRGLTRTIYHVPDTAFTILSDMSHLLQNEDWQPENAPESITYGCEVISDSSPPIQTDAGPVWTPEREDRVGALERVRAGRAGDRPPRADERRAVASRQLAPHLH
jgi:hypothetical protein